MTLQSPPGADDALKAAARLPRPMVFTDGVFDLLHAGHIQCLEEARSQGQSLVVGINSDVSVSRLRKPPGRPFNTEDDRCRVVAALSMVSAVILFDEATPLALLSRLRPDVYFKGVDHGGPQPLEAVLVGRWGGRTVISPLLPGLSTSSIVERILSTA